MSDNIFHRITEGFATLSDFTKAAQTDIKTRSLQRTLDERRSQQIAVADRPTSLTTGNIFQDIAREFQRTGGRERSVQLPARQPAQFQRRIVTEEERERARGTIQMGIDFLRILVDEERLNIYHTDDIDPKYFL